MSRRSSSSRLQLDSKSLPPGSSRGQRKRKVPPPTNGSFSGNQFDRIHSSGQLDGSILLFLVPQIPEEFEPVWWRLRIRHSAISPNEVKSVPNSFPDDFLNLIVSMHRANGQDLFSLGITAVVLNLRAVA